MNQGVCFRGSSATERVRLFFSTWGVCVIILLAQELQELGGDSFPLHLLFRDAVTFVAGGAVLLLLSLWATRRLRDAGFDLLFVLPWKSPYALRGQERPTGRASTLVGRGLLLTGLVYLLFVLLEWHAAAPLEAARVLGYFGQVWMLLVTLCVALALSRFVALAVISIFDNPTVRTQLELICPHEPAAVASPGRGQETPREPAEQVVAEVDRRTVQPTIDDSASAARIEQLLDEADDQPPPAPRLATETIRRSPESFADTVARLIGMLIYLMVFLPVLMIAAEIWGWTAAGSSLGEIWQWLLPFAGLSATVLIGWFALTAVALSFCPVRMRRSVMIVTTLLALILLTASYNMAFAIVFAVCLLALVWLTRNDVPDAFAGLYLQTQKRVTVKTTHGPGHALERQLLTCEIGTLSGTFRVRNRYVLRSFLDGQMLDDSRLVAVEGNPSQHTAEAPAEQSAGMNQADESPGAPA